MPAAHKGFFSLLCYLRTPATERAQSDPQVVRNLSLRFSTGLDQAHRFLFERLVLRSSKAIPKETAEVAAWLERPSPNPGLGAMVELDSRNLHGSLDFSRIGKTLTSQRIPAEEPPPPFLQVQPARAFREKDVLKARMVHQPGTRFQTIMAAQIIRDDENVPFRVVRLDQFEQLHVIFGIARPRASREFLAIAHPERSIDPHLVIPPAVL